METLRLLEGVIDVYLPDFKFWDVAVAGQLSQVSPSWVELYC